MDNQDFDVLSAEIVEQIAEFTSMLKKRKIPSEAEIDSLSKKFAVLREISGRQFKKAENILGRFTRIQAKSSEYALALKPCQNEAQKLLKNLSGVNVEELAPIVERYEALLSALESENLSGNSELLEQYPPKVLVGLITKQYYAEEDSRNEAAEEQESGEEIDELELDAAAEEMDTELEDEEPAGMIAAKNKLKTGTPSASSFKKDIIKLAKVHHDVLIVLPLLTNLGALRKIEFAALCACMGWRDKSEEDRAALEAAVDALAQKGLLACYEFYDDEMYCLTDYCLGCLMKDSISVQMRRLWEVSLGKYRFTGGKEISRSRLVYAARMNNSLFKYLFAARVLLSNDDFKAVRQSIRFEDGYYHFDVVDRGETFRCTMLLRMHDLENFRGENAFLCAGSDPYPDRMSPTIKTVFILYQETDLARYDGLNGIMRPYELREEFEVPEAVSESVQDTQTEPDPPEYEYPSGEPDTVSEAAQSEQTAPDSPEHEENHEPDSASSLQLMLESPKPPSDDEFCETIFYLLNRKADSPETLKSFVVESVLFAAGAALEKDRPKAAKLSAQLKLASHLLTEHDAYSSEHLALVFSNPEKDPPELFLAAYLSAMLSPSASYDYGLKNQTKVFFANYDEYFADFPEFKPLFSKLLALHEAADKGFSPAVIAMIGSEAKNDAFLDELKSEAAGCLKLQSPKARMNALPPLYKNCFGSDSDLWECMKIISENNTSKDSIELVETVLDEYCRRDGESFTLDMEKIESRLDSEWDKINAKNRFKLVSIARDQALRQFTQRLELMTAWHDHVLSTRNQKDISRLRALKQEILSLCSEIQAGGTYTNILSWLLWFIKNYLNGETSAVQIYSELLSTGVIPVNDDCSPKIDPALSEVRFYELWRSALLHILSAKRPPEELKAEILGSNITDDDAGLRDNFHQLVMLGKMLGSTDDDYTVTDSQLKEAADSADERTEHFRDTLELAYTYSQINDLEKDKLSGLTSRYKDEFYASMEFAGWRRFLEALERQIKEFAAAKKSVLKSELDTRLQKAPDAAILHEAGRMLDEEMNLAVAEEYINRFDSGDTELDEDIIHETDYFAEFLSRENFDKLLQECRRNDGRTLKSFGWKFIERSLPENWTNRLRDDSKRLIESWPSNKYAASTEQIKTLFTCLGLNVESVSKMSITNRKEEMFQLMIIPEPKSKADYRHPVAAFGTQLKSPVNVIVLYGNYTEKQLVDTISSLDLGGISIVLLDRPLEAARRRKIGEIFHTQTSGQNPFLLIDQVLCLYLAAHQVTERLPALLKCTLPYSSYQPFVRDGGSTADEMFCGRLQELNTIIDPNGACVVYGGRQLGKTALLERAESRCSKPENKAFAVYSTIAKIQDEAEVVSVLVSDINRKTDGKITLTHCTTLREMCSQLSRMFSKRKIASMHLFIDEVDSFLEAAAGDSYKSLQPLVDLRRETKNSFKFVIAGLHNVCRAKNATRYNGIFGQLGTPLCIRPLSPSDALKLLVRPLNFLGFQIDRYPHLETILTNTNYYPGILQFFGYMLVQTLSVQYSKYYNAADGNPPFTLRDEQLGSVMNSSDLNKSIKDKFRLTLELDQRYFMIARCIAVLYHCYDGERTSSGRLGFSVEEIIKTAEAYEIHCLENLLPGEYTVLLDEMEEMGILSRPENGRYKLRRNSFVDIIGENIDALERDIASGNQEG